MSISLATLQARYAFDAAEARVRDVVETVVADDRALLRFLGRYIAWNAGFGPGVATLAGKIGRNHTLFLDPDEPLPELADRGIHVASFVFDAARDEFDDGATRHRDTHRSLGQAVLKGLIEVQQIGDPGPLLRRPDWLVALEDDVQRGYGHGTPDDRAHVARGLGFHLGSEILADEEFSLIDATLRDRRPELVQALLRRRVRIADADHPAYYWIGIHSGHGGQVEADHFAWAVKGVEHALATTPAPLRAAFEADVLAGFDAFCACHGAFFARVLEG